MAVIYFLSGIFGIGWSANMTPSSGLLALLSFCDEMLELTVLLLLLENSFGGRNRAYVRTSGLTVP